MSYLRLDPSLDVGGLIANMPAWRDDPGGYKLPLETIRCLDLPTVNIGPYGHGVHSPDERVLMAYSFGTVPQLILETIERLAQSTV
jgi:arginine utilization protein RocB